MDDHAPEGASQAEASLSAAPETYAIPDVTFENGSELAAIHFDTVDQHGAAFHVFVAKTAYALGPHDEYGVAPLSPAPAPAPLLAEDLRYANDPSASVLQESDFAPYKPQCDVMVNATAYAPLGLPVRKFQVSLLVQRPLPATASQTPTPPMAPTEFVTLVAKMLDVHGERSFKRHCAPWRVVLWTIKLLTLTLWRPAPWRLTRAARFSELPLRYEFAEGGACRIDADDRAARRVARKHRLAPSSVTAPGSAESDADAPQASPAIAHEVCQTNPLGRGFTRRWYLKARRITTLPAPRICDVKQPASARDFWRAACGADLAPPAGLGSVGRAWLPRRALAGTFDHKTHWQPDEVPGLPADFDFAYWNSTPADQQCAHLTGGEQVTLINLCRPEHPSAQISLRGNSVLRFSLPVQAMFLLLVDDDNKIAITRLVIDTVVIAPDAATVQLVWRSCLPAEGAFHTARLMHLTDAGQIARLDLLEKTQAQAADLMNQATTANSPAAGPVNTSTLS